MEVLRGGEVRTSRSKCERLMKMEKEAKRQKGKGKREDHKKGEEAEGQQVQEGDTEEGESEEWRGRRKGLLLIQLSVYESEMKSGGSSTRTSTKLAKRHCKGS